MKIGKLYSFMRIFLLMGLFLVRCAHADEFDFTDEERTKFIDDSDYFEKKVFKGIDFGYVFWVDETTLIFSTSSLPNGWKRGDDGLSKIVTLNTQTREIHETTYKGYLQCYTKEGMFVVHPAYGTLRAHHQYFIGVAGQALEQINFDKLDPFINWNGCTVIKFENKSGIFEMPHFSKRIVTFGGLTGPKSTKMLIETEDGKLVNEIDLPQRLRVLDGKYFVYLPFIDKYLIRHTIPGYSWQGQNYSGGLVSRDGSFELIRTNQFLQELAEKNQGSGSFLVGHDGIFWGFRTWNTFWKKQGLYFQSNESLRRVDKGKIDILNISPSGCKLAYGRDQSNDGPTREASQTRNELVVLNICKGN